MRTARLARACIVPVLVSLVATACDDDPAPAKPVPPPEPITGAAVEKPVAVGTDPCTFPTAPAATREETAWRLFVAATCPTTNASLPLAFETWTEQTCLIAPSTPGCSDATARRPHGSHLAAALAARAADGLPPVANECTSMTTSSTTVTSLLPYVPKNLSAKPQFCEEVFANAPEVAYARQPVEGASLLTLTQQAAYLTSGHAIAFPTDAVEVKADWLPVASTSPAAFDCAAPPPGLYTETIQGQCYALVGMHISSKLYPNWLWATFEPQFAGTNPNRCNPNLYGSCSDAWGSDPATSTGADTKQTAALAALMKEAKLPAALANYRLVGTQTDYTNTDTTLLGNSFVEFNASVPAQQASCITCHSYAQLNTADGGAVENPNFGAFPGTPPTGTPVTTQPPVPAGTWQPQDFSWLLGVMPASASSN